MTSGGDLCHIGTTKLIYEANRWTGFCLIRFLPEGRSEQTMILHLSGSAKYTTVLMSVFPGNVSAGLGHHRVGVCFHFGASEVK